MVVKLKLKVGNIEVDYEGEEAFLRGDVIGMIEHIAGLSVAVQVPAPISPGNSGPTSPNNQQTIQMSVTNIAQKMGVKSGSDLALAAAAYLTLVRGKDTFPRKEILETMQDATSFYKDTYGGHLTESLTKLTKDSKLIERTSGVYALQASQRQTLEVLLANS